MSNSVVTNRVRLEVPSFSPAYMHGMGQAVIGTIFARWNRAQQVDGSAAPPLKPGKLTGKIGPNGQPLQYQSYAQRKSRPPYNRQPIRNLLFRGGLRHSIQVKRSAENTVWIGPLDPHNNMVLAVNNRRSFMWGIGAAERMAIFNYYRNTPVFRVLSTKVA